jgi:hypothetical protein
MSLRTTGARGLADAWWSVSLASKWSAKVSRVIRSPPALGADLHPRAELGGALGLVKAALLALAPVALGVQGPGAADGYGVHAG